jgi:hypothetical protein
MKANRNDIFHRNQRPQKRECAANRAINSHMEKSVRWMLFEYNGLELVILSKPFKTKKLTGKEREKYPERERGKIVIFARNYRRKHESPHALQLVDLLDAVNQYLNQLACCKPDERFRIAN